MSDPRPTDDKDVVVAGDISLPVVHRKAPMIPAPDTPLVKCPTNLDLTTFKGKAMAIAAGNPGDILFDKEGKACISVTHYLVFPDRGVNQETGEESDYSRTVLFDKDGNTYRTTSLYAPERIRQILELFGAEEWAAGIPFVIRERRSPKTGKTYHDIRVDLNARKAVD